MNYGLSFAATPCIHLPSRLEHLSCPEDVATSRWCPPVVFVNLCLWHINEKMVDICGWKKNAEPTVLGVMFIHLTSINQLYIHEKTIKVLILALVAPGAAEVVGGSGSMLFDKHPLTSVLST